MHQGKVKFFDSAKGFGFIKEEGSEQDHFVHVTGLIDNVQEGDDVTFELQEGRRGLNAVKVRLA